MSKNIRYLYLIMILCIVFLSVGALSAACADDTDGVVINSDSSVIDDNGTCVDSLIYDNCTCTDSDIDTYDDSLDADDYLDDDVIDDSLDADDYLDDDVIDDSPVIPYGLEDNDTGYMSRSLNAVSFKSVSHTDNYSLCSSSVSNTDSDSQVCGSSLNNGDESSLSDSFHGNSDYGGLIIGSQYSLLSDDKYLATNNVRYDDSVMPKTSILSAADSLLTDDVKEITVISCDNLTMYYKDGSRFRFYLKDVNGNPLADETVYFKVGNAVYELRTDDDGMASINIGMNPTKVNVLLYYLGNENYTASNNTGRITVNKRSYDVEVNDLYESYGDGKYFTATVRDNLGNVLVNQEVSFVIVGKTYKTYTNSEGIASLQINLRPGVYSIQTVINGSKQYNGFVSSNTVTVVRNSSSTIIHGDNLTMYYRDGSRFRFHLRDAEGNPIVNETVYFKVWGSVYELITDDEGMASINIGLNPADATVSYYYLGSEGRYDPSNGTARITVNKRSYDVETSNFTETYGDGKYFTATVRDNLGNVLANQEVSFDIVGQTYRRLTDSNGIASLKINLRPGTYDIRTSVKSDKHYSGFTANNTVRVIKNSTNLKIISGNTYINGDELKIQLKDILGNTIENQKITVNLNNVNYTENTDKNGIIYITVPALKNGNYKVSYKYENSNNKLSSANSTTIKIVENRTRITGRNISTRNNSDDNYSVNLTDPYGNPLKGETVSFRINNSARIYNVTTDNRGMASIKLNLPVGKYRIEYVFNGNGKYPGVKGESTVTVTHITDSFTINDIVKASYAVKAYIDKNGKLPAAVNIGGINCTLAQYLYYESFAISKINSSNNSEIKFISRISEPGSPNLGDTVSYQKLNKNGYTSSAANTYKYISSNSRGPNYSSTSIGRISYNKLIEVFNEILVYYGNKGALPENVPVYSHIGNYTYFTVPGTSKFVNGNKFSVTLKDSWSNIIAGEKISFTINGKTYTGTTNSKGVASLTIPKLNGNYTIKYTYTNGNSRLSSSGSKTVSIFSNVTKITGANMKTTNNSGAKFNITLNDCYGNPISGAKIQYNISGIDKTYSVTTNSKGIASFAVKLPSGNYTVSYRFNGNSNYPAASGRNNILVSKIITSISIDSLIDAAKDVKEEYSATSKNTKYSFNKYGVSSDGKYIMAIGRPSATGELSKYGYSFYRSVFLRTCPQCGSHNLYWGIFWAGNEYDSYGTFPATGNKEGGSAEGHIFCKDCDADYSCIEGKDHSTTPKYYLTKIGETVNVAKSEAYRLLNGTMTNVDILSSQGKIPSYISIDGSTVTRAQYLYYICRAVSQLDKGNTSDLSLVMYMGEPSNPNSGDSISGSLSRSAYVDSATRTYRYLLSNLQGPNYSSTTLGKVSYNELIKMFTEILIYYGNNKKLPGSFKLNI